MDLPISTEVTPTDGKAASLSMYVFSQLLRAGLTVCLMPVYTSYIMPEGFGITEYFGIVLMIGLWLVNWGLPNAYDRFFFAYDESRRPQLLASILGISTLLLAFFVIVVHATREPIASLFVPGTEWSPLLSLVFLNGSLTHLNALCFAYLKNSQQPREYVRLEVLRSLVFHAAALVAIVRYDLGIWGYIGGLTLSQTCTFVTFVLRHRPWRFCGINPSILKECFSFGWPLMFKAAAGLASRGLNRYLLAALVSLSALGIFSKAHVLALYVFSLMTTVQNVYAPLWNKRLFGYKDAPAQSMGALFSEFCIITTYPAACLMLFSHEIVSSVTAAAYHGAVPLVVILSYHYSLLTFGKLHGTLFAYLKMMKHVSALSIVSQGINIGLNFLLIPRIGALGAAFSILGASIFMLTASSAVISKRHVVGYEFGHLIGHHLLLTTCAVVPCLCYFGQIDHLPGLGIRVALFIVVTAMSIWRLKTASSVRFLRLAFFKKENLQ